MLSRESAVPLPQGNDQSDRRIILITGANGALGTGLVERILQDKTFSHENILFVLSTRSLPKFEQTKEKLLVQFPLARMEPLILDLCNTKSILNAALEFQNRYERLDALVCNAGMMPLERIDVWGGTKDLFTRPAFLAKTGGDALVQKTGIKTKEGLGETFSANVFGHYVLIRQLLPFLSEAKGGVVWFTSTTAIPEFFDLHDLQCLNGSRPYESSKRLCELLGISWGSLLKKQGVSTYVVSPGNFQSGIVGGAVSSYLLILVLYIMRLLCLSGSNVTGTNAATSALHILKCQWEKRELNPNVVYHSEINVFGKRWAASYPIEREDEQAQKELLEQLNQLYLKHTSINTEKVRS